MSMTSGRFAEAAQAFINIYCQPTLTTVPYTTEHNEEASKLGIEAETLAEQKDKKALDRMRKGIALHIQCFRCKVAHNKTHAIVSFASRSGCVVVQAFLRTLLELLTEEAEGEALFGTAPAGQNERAVRDLLQRLESQIDEA